MKRSSSLSCGILAALFLTSGPLTAQIQPGNGIKLGKTTLLVPQISASYSYNDNINLRRRAVDEGGERLDVNDSDSFISGQASLSLRHWNRSSQINSKVWYNVEDYEEFDNLEEPSYGVNLSHFWARPGAETSLNTEVSYQSAVDRSERNEGFIGESRLSEELENVAERVEREELRAALTLDQALMTDVRGSFSYAFTDIAYDAERFNDRTSQNLSGELNYQMTEKTQPYFRLGIGLDDDNGLDGDAEKPFYLIGVRYRATEKIDIDLGVGYEEYNRTPLEGVNAGVELEDSNVKWTGRINYTPTHKTRITLSGRTGYNSVASPGSSSREEISASLALNHQTTRQLSQRASLAWRNDDYLSLFPARGDLFDEEKETFFYQYRIDYQTVRPWLSVFLQLGYEDGSSEIPGDSYTETEISVGATARY